MKFLVLVALGAIIYSANGASLFKRDAKSDALAKATDLEKQATDEAEKQKAAGRTMEAERLTAEAKRLTAVAAELTAATAEATITRLTHELGAIEQRIAAEIKRDEGRTGTVPAGTTPVAATTAASVFKRDAKSDALAKAADLEKQATDEAEKQKAAGRTMEAERLTAEAKRLTAVAAELTAATAEATITRLTHELGAIEQRIAAEIKRDEGRTGTVPAGTTPVAATTAASFVKRDAKDDALTKAADLEKQATDEAEKQKAAGRNMEAERLTAEAKRLTAVAAELKAATAEATVTRLTRELEAIEARIAAEIKRDEGRTGTVPAGTTPVAATTAATF